jgi:hypothetical protein
VMGIPTPTLEPCLALTSAIPPGSAAKPSSDCRQRTLSTVRLSILSVLSWARLLPQRAGRRGSDTSAWRIVADLRSPRFDRKRPDGESRSSEPPSAGWAESP